MKIKAKKNITLADGRQVRKGAVTEAPAREARQLLAAGKAVASSAETQEESTVKSSIDNNDETGGQDAPLSKDFSQTPKPEQPSEKAEEGVWDKIKSYADRRNS